MMRRLFSDLVWFCAQAAGLGLLAVGLWQVFPPAALVVTGMGLMVLGRGIPRETDSDGEL